VFTKIEIIQNISSLDPESDDFLTECETYVDSVDNEWYDPFISGDITSTRICTGLQTLYSTLNDESDTDLSDYVIYTYALLYNLQGSSSEEDIYNSCIDGRI
jgi:hypothetical protein